MQHLAVFAYILKKVYHQLPAWQKTQVMGVQGE